MDFEKKHIQVIIILFFIRIMMTCIWFFEKQQNNKNSLTPAQLSEMREMSTYKVKAAELGDDLLNMIGDTLPFDYTQDELKCDFRDIVQDIFNKAPDVITDAEYTEVQ